MENAAAAARRQSEIFMAHCVIYFVSKILKALRANENLISPRPPPLGWRYFLFKSNTAVTIYKKICKWRAAAL